MHPTREDILKIDRDKVLRARAMTVEERLRAGFEAFALVRRLMLDGIRTEFPEADQVEQNEILHQRLAIGKRIQNAPYR